MEPESNIEGEQKYDNQQEFAPKKRIRKEFRWDEAPPQTQTPKTPQKLARVALGTATVWLYILDVVFQLMANFLKMVLPQIVAMFMLALWMFAYEGRFNVTVLVVTWALNTHEFVTEIIWKAGYTGKYFLSQDIWSSVVKGLVPTLHTDTITRLRNICQTLEENYQPCAERQFRFFLGYGLLFYQGVLKQKHATYIEYFYYCSILLGSFLTLCAEFLRPMRLRLAILLSDFSRRTMHN